MSNIAKIISGVAVVIIVGVGAYFGLTQKFNVAQVSPTPTSIGVEYRNEQYGFSITLTDSWKGYTAVQDRWEGYIGDGKGTQGGTDQGPQIVLYYPGTTSGFPHQHEWMPIMIFTPKQWDLVAAGGSLNGSPQWFMAVGAAPIPPSLLGRNSQYVFALPARYNYDFATGWEEVDRLVHQLKTFEPALVLKSYTNNQYGFSFQYPVSWSYQAQATAIPLDIQFSRPDTCSTSDMMGCAGGMQLEVTVENNTDVQDYWNRTNRKTITFGNNLFSEKLLNDNVKVYLIKNTSSTLTFKLNSVDTTYPQILSTFKFTK